MSLPSTPTYTFSIPSIHDRLRLDCRIYLPPDLRKRLLHGSSSSDRPLLRGAIIAHPYAPLGGCFDDPVVGVVGGEVLRLGCVVGTFNFRGAGGSEGRTSWTARPELADYVSFYGFMLLYLHFLGERAVQQEGGGDRGKIGVILGGYSYGSMIASHLPKLHDIVGLVRRSSPESPFHEIYQVAEKLSLCLSLGEEMKQPTYRPATVEEMRSAADSIKLTAAVSYLLVSPLLPPVNQFLTLFSKMSLDASAQTSSAPGQGKQGQIPCPKPADQLCAHETLAIFGDEDTFTSASKLEKWSAELAHAPGSRFQAVEIEGAGHFWREHGVEAQARQAIRDWVCQMSTS
ncbi:Alpha/Beta hydrolase protein [Aspergillus welwitschiae]|uniref:Alpha/Beta hydrolase protein n=2 Tax=Aspergillus subgen. Circumdati TaxID=2720871 RepID=A0A3F3QKA6_9EURO|nr:Alpha/Beta hydrolase protein [Aspergillus welwitschiae]RDH39565.1 Alpha/Beta hydrolase protein [Aspergillus welwitschiae]